MTGTQVLSMVELFCLITALKLFEFPIVLGEYNNHVTYFALQKVKNGRQFFLLASLVTFVFSLASGFAGIQIVYATLKEKSKMLFDCPEELLTAIIKRSSGLSAFLSPIFPLLPMVLAYSGLQWIQLFPYGLLLCCIGLLLSMVISFYFSPSLSSLKYNLDNSTVETPVNKIRLAQFFIIIVVNVSLLVVLDAFRIGNMIKILFINCLIIPVLWALAIKESRRFVEKCKAYFKGNASELSTIFILLISAGFYSNTINFETHDFRILGSLMENRFLLLTVIPLSVIIITMLGINSFISVTFVAGLVGVLHISIAPVTFGVALISGAVIANIVSPFSASSLLMSNLTGHTPIKVGLNWNWMFCLIFYCISLIFNVLAIQ